MKLEAVRAIVVAHVRSLCGAVEGRHVKIRRRLSVSPGPATLNGPVIVMLSMRGTPSASTTSVVPMSGRNHA